MQESVQVVAVLANPARLTSIADCLIVRLLDWCIFFGNFSAPTSVTIVNLARENGITDLFVLDKKFVLDALKEKMEREGLI